jgi:ATP-binding cassette subfamily B protein
VFIRRLPETYNAPVRERGSNFSGGQRQLLSLARVLVFQPEILVMDEATSSVDTETEALIQDALEKAMRGRTCLVIAHRLSTIRNATRILVFDNGRVIESGTFDELVAKGGRFAELARAQFMVQEHARTAVNTPKETQKPDGGKIPG